jgi:multidrug efflux pump subunit AcrB
VERLIRFFVERHMLVNVMVAVVLVLGWLQATRAPRETFPNVTMPTLIVSATLPGASARDVETKVAIPIQEAVEELNGVQEFNTIVRDGASVTTVELSDEFDAARVREAERDLQVLLDATRGFPDEMRDEPVISRLNPKLQPVIQIALGGPTDAVVEAAHVLERRLRRLEQVSKVELVGLADPEARILVDPVRARAHGVTLLDVARAVEARNVSSTGGLLETARDRRQVVLWSRYGHPSEAVDTVIRFEPAGGVLRVGDVARVELAREDIGLFAHTNGRPGVSVVVNKQEDADIVDSVDAIRAEVGATTLPDAVDVVFVRDESFMARNRLQLMYVNGLIGSVLVAVVLFLFLTPGSAAWTLVGIPVVFLGTLALFPVFGFSINLITLTGLVVVLGMIVDDAVVVSERIVARRQLGETRSVASVRGAAEMARPVTASAVTTMIAFMPLWGLGGMPGEVIRAMPAVVIVALAVSVLESFSVLPAHLSMGRGGAEPPKRRFVRRMEERYRDLVGRSLEHRGWLVAGFAAALALTLGVIAPRSPVVLFPQDDSEAAHIKISMPLGTPIERTEAVAASIQRQLPRLMGDDVTAVTARVGHQRAGHRLDVMGGEERGSAENEAVVSVMIRPVGRNHTSAEWIEIFTRELALPPEATVVYAAEFQGPPVGSPVEVHVSSNRDDVRRPTALEVADWLRGVDGVTDVEIDERPGTPQVELGLDYERLALRGLAAEDVARTIQIAFHGLIASEHRELDDTTDFRVMLEPSARRSLDALLELPVRSRGGELVVLRDVVTPIDVPAVSRIYHRDGRRTATVSAQIAASSSRTALSLAQRMEADLLPRYADRAGLEVSLGGEAIETRKTTGDLGLAAGLAFVGIGLVISLMLGSFLEAAFVVAIIPFAIAGVVLAFFLHGQPLSMFAMMGAIGLAGVVVNASIVMVDAVHRRLRDIPEEDREARREALVDAVVGRLRPIVVTTLTTLGGVMPMAYGIGGYDAIVSPMSLALGWGLALSTAVTLFLVPTLYTLASDVRGLRRRRAGPPPLRAVEGRSLHGLASSSSSRSTPEV